MSRRGLPKKFKPAKELHYVEALLEKAAQPVIRMIPVDRIDPNPWQPRQDFGDLEELARSIRDRGLLEPILVRPHGERYQVVAGERRLRACQMAGLTEVPCIELEISNSEMLEIALIENLQRKDLDPFEEAEAYHRLIEEFGYTHAELARVLGKARSTITEVLRLREIPEPIRAMCRAHGILSRRQLLTIARQPDVAAMRFCVEEMRRASSPAGASATARAASSPSTARSPSAERQRTPASRRPFVYRDPFGVFELRMRFYRGTYTADAIRAALQQVIDAIDRGDIRTDEA